MVKHCSIRLILAVVAQHELILHQLDVKTAFVHGNLEEMIFMTIPDGVVSDKSKDQVCLLLKYLYGMK